jgi:hypothetical protein
VDGEVVYKTLTTYITIPERARPRKDPVRKSEVRDGTLYFTFQTCSPRFSDRFASFDCCVAVKEIASLSLTIDPLLLS